MSLRVWDLPDDLQKRLRDLQKRFYVPYKFSLPEIEIDESIFLLILAEVFRCDRGFRRVSEHQKLVKDLSDFKKNSKETIDNLKVGSIWSLKSDPKDDGNYILDQKFPEFDQVSLVHRWANYRHQTNLTGSGNLFEEYNCVSENK